MVVNDANLLTAYKINVIVISMIVKKSHLRESDKTIFHDCLVTQLKSQFPKKKVYRRVKT
jgi:hypothetical protein